MDGSGRLEKRIRRTKIPRAFSFPKLVKRKSRDHPRAYYSFLRQAAKEAYGRIDPNDRYFKRLLIAFPDMMRGFSEIFPQVMSNNNDHVETPRPAKEAKTEDDSSKAVTEFDPTSETSTSYASGYSQSPGSSGCYPLEWEAVASCSSSSPSRPGNAAEDYGAQNKETAQLRDRTLYVKETKTKLMDGTQACEHLTELVNEISSNRIDTYAIMERASNLLQGYPDMIENFNIFLPDGYKIVILSDDDEMSAG